MSNWTQIGFTLYGSVSQRMVRDVIDSETRYWAGKVRALTPEEAAAMNIGPFGENGGKTGWPPGMLQDDDKKLSKALSGKVDSRMHAREAAEQITRACRKCGGTMKPGIATGQTVSTSDEGTCSPAGPGKIIDCMKCSACGWSVTQEKKG